MTLIKINNNRKVNGYSTFNELFDTYFKEELKSDKSLAKLPAVNIFESENQFHVELAAPGLKKQDFKIAIDKDVLTISAAKKTETINENIKINRKEFNFSSFVRSFNLPESIDHANIEASYADGILKVDIAKKEEAKVQTREITIK